MIIQLLLNTHLDRDYELQSSPRDLGLKNYHHGNRWAIFYFQVQVSFYTGLRVVLLPFVVTNV